MAARGEARACRRSSSPRTCSCSGSRPRRARQALERVPGIGPNVSTPAGLRSSARQEGDRAISRWTRHGRQSDGSGIGLPRRSGPMTQHAGLLVCWVP
jgi:hypothetical protein